VAAGQRLTRISPVDTQKQNVEVVGLMAGCVDGMDLAAKAVVLMAFAHCFDHGDGVGSERILLQYLQ
jgi:hypothetical protein